MTGALTFFASWHMIRLVVVHYFHDNSANITILKKNECIVHSIETWKPNIEMRHENYHSKKEV